MARDSTYDTTCRASAALYGNPILQVVSPIDALDVIASAPSEWSDGSLYEEDTYFPKGEARKGWLLDDDAG